MRSRFLEGAVFGAVAGAVVGLLFAPTSGEETRRRLAKMKADKLAKLNCEKDSLLDTAKESTDTLISRTMDAIEDGFDKVSKLIEDRKG